MQLEQIAEYAPQMQEPSVIYDGSSYEGADGLYGLLTGKIVPLLTPSGSETVVISRSDTMKLYIDLLRNDVNVGYQERKTKHRDQARIDGIDKAYD